MYPTLFLFVIKTTFEVRKGFDTFTRPKPLTMLKQNFILVAEDDNDDRQMLLSVFKARNIETPIEFVGNGIELIHYLEKIKIGGDEYHYPRFILLDLNMPKMDGRQALKALKSNTEFKKIPVIVFSTTENAVEIARCYELGANTYVVKPSSYNGLLKTVDTINDFWLNIASIPQGKLL